MSDTSWPTSVWTEASLLSDRLTRSMLSAGAVDSVARVQVQMKYCNSSELKANLSTKLQKVKADVHRRRINRLVVLRDLKFQHDSWYDRDAAHRVDVEPDLEPSIGLLYDTKCISARAAA